RSTGKRKCVATLNFNPTSRAGCVTVQGGIRVQHSIRWRRRRKGNQTHLNRLRDHGNVDVGWIDVGQIWNGQCVVEHVEIAWVKSPKQIIVVRLSELPGCPGTVKRFPQGTAFEHSQAGIPWKIP